METQPITPQVDVGELFSVKGLVALVTGGGTGKVHTDHVSAKKRISHHYTFELQAVF